jgi:hypothetical protein
MMQEAGQANAIQLLFVELRVGLAQSAIQSALLLNGGAAIAILFYASTPHTSQAPDSLPVNAVLIKWAFVMFGLGLFVAAMTFVNAYVAQGAIASGQSSAFGEVLRRLGLSFIVISLLLFLAGMALAAAAI